MQPEITQPQETNIEPILEAQLLQSSEIGNETNALLETIIQQNSENNLEPTLEASIAQSISNTDKVVEALKPTSEAVGKMVAFLSEMKGEKGDKGEPGDDGVNGVDADESRVIESVLSQIPVPENGTDGRDGVDGVNGVDGRDGKDGRHGIDGKDAVTPQIDYKKVVAETVKQIPKIDIDEQVKEITDKVSQNTNESLQRLKSVATKSYAMSELADTQLAITGQTMVKQADGSWAPATGGSGSAHTIEDEGTPLTQRSTLNFVGAGVTVTDVGAKTTVTIPGGGGGITVTSPAINGTNVYVDAVLAKWIDTDTGHYYDGFGYVRTGAGPYTYTFDLTPNLYVRLVS